MPLLRPAKIEAALLYRDYQTFDYAPFVARLQVVFGDDIPVGLGLHQDGSFGIIKVGGIFIKLSQNSSALASDGFKAALASPYTQLEQPDAKKRVLAHRKNIFVTVGDDSILMPDLDQGTLSPEMMKMLADIVPQEKMPSIDEFSERVHVARIVISQLIGMNQPDLVHWCQSDQLFKPEQMLPAHDPRGMALQIHPSLYSTGAVKNVGQKIGFHAFGSEHVSGHHVFVEETTTALSWVVEVVNEFIYSLSRTGDLPASGTTVQMKSGAVLRVTQAAGDQRFPRSYLLVEMVEPGTPTLRSPQTDKATKTGKKRPGTAFSKRLGLTVFQKFGTLAAAVVLYLVVSQLMGISGGVELAALTSR